MSANEKSGMSRRLLSTSLLRQSNKDILETDRNEYSRVNENRQNK